MKPLLALTLLAVVAAGCGAAKARSKEHLATVTVSTSRLSGTSSGSVVTVVGRRITLPDVKTGALVKCGNGAGARVPAPGESVIGSSATNKSGGGIQLRHLRNGSVTVACTRPH